jgi:phenylacetate-CoA ligase
MFNAFRLDEATMEATIQAVNRHPRTVVVGYVQALYELAVYILEKNRSIHAPQAVLVTAGVCYPELRAKITQAFRAPVVNRYGSREVGNIACEVPGRAGLEVAPTCLLEVDTGEGIHASGEGDLLVTSLVNEVMPLIRYRIGDRGVLCTEGEAQTLTSILGRSVDMFRTADGTLVDGEFFTHLLYSIRGISMFQVIQRSLQEVEFILCAPHDSVAGEEARIRQSVQTAMGSDCTVRFTYVESIDPHASGKHRYTICEV